MMGMYGGGKGMFNNQMMQNMGQQMAQGGQVPSLLLTNLKNMMNMNQGGMMMPNQNWQQMMMA